MTASGLEQQRVALGAQADGPEQVASWPQLVDGLIELMVDNRELLLLHSRNRSAFEALGESKRNRQENEDLRPRLPRILSSSAIPLRERVGMAAIIGIITEVFGDSATASGTLELVHGVRAVADSETALSAGVARQLIANSVAYVRAVLYNGLGRYDDALAAARQATEYAEDVAFSTWGLVELIEAAARSGKVELAADALGRLCKTTSSSGTDLAQGVKARSQALLSEGEAAETLYRQAIELLTRTRVRMELARAHLLYGEWLRRERRRLDAREQLRHADRLFAEFGTQAFGQRARVELEATGEHARKRTVETRDDLTPREAQISRLAADGATNKQIAGQLFISSSTVDYHLRKAFRKLGVESRHQLEQHVLESGHPRAGADMR